MRLLFIIVAGTIAVPAHDVITTKLTWSAEISRLVYARCLGCHREGGPAPMPLATYQDARPWAKAIRDEVLSRRMPPWGAIKGFRDLQDDMSLTQDQITRIAEWVEGGAPEGDPKYLPDAGPQPMPESRTSAKRIRAGTLRSGLRLVGIHPLQDVDDEKIFARTPEGGVEPLIWLHGYRSKWNRTFLFRVPLNLPAGTVIDVSPSIGIELVVKPPLRAH